MEIKTFESGLFVNDQENNFLGRLFGRLINENHFIVTNIELNTNDVKIARDLLDHVKTMHPQAMMHILSWNEESNKEYEEILKRLGHTISFGKNYYKREISNFKSPYEDFFEYKSLLKLDRKVIIEILDDFRKADPSENKNISIEEAFADTIANIDSSIGSEWIAAYLNNNVVGIILPNIYPDDPEAGTLTHFGVCSQFRGKGYAKILHAKGLEVLSKLNAKTYLGSTHVDNYPMKKVFENNQCIEIGIRRHWEGPIC